MRELLVGRIDEALAAKIRKSPPARDVLRSEIQNDPRTLALVRGATFGLPVPKQTDDLVERALTMNLDETSLPLIRTVVARASAATR